MKNPRYLITIVGQGTMYSAFVRGSKVIVEETEVSSGSKSEIGSFRKQGRYNQQAYTAVHVIQNHTGFKISGRALSEERI